MEGLRITDAHVHVQPWDQLKPHVRARMAKDAQFRGARPRMRDPASILERMDEAGIGADRRHQLREPALMGFTRDVNPYVANLARRRRAT